METFQESYHKARQPLTELRKAASRMSLSTETRRALMDEIERIERNTEKAKEYVMNSEELAYEAIGLKRDIENDDRYFEELEELFKSVNHGKLEDIDGINERNMQIERIRELIYRVSANDKTRSDLKGKTFKELEELNRIYFSENQKNKIRLGHIFNDIEITRGKILSEMETFEEHTKEKAETDLPKLDDSEEKTPLEDNQVETSTQKIQDAKQFQKLIEERKDNWDKISQIRGYRLDSGKYRADASKMKALREDVKKRDDFIKKYINEFSMNPDYKVSDELALLIGVRDEARDRREGKFGSTLTRPNVKQHLEPILEIEKELANFKKYALTPEEAAKKKKLEEEKAKREKRLGKKWLLKLKIDKLNSEIKDLEAELKNASPERRKEILEQLSAKRAELGKLEKEYGEVLNQIAGLIADTVEKEELRKNGVKTFDELKVKFHKDGNHEEKDETGEVHKNGEDGKNISGGTSTINGATHVNNGAVNTPSAGYAYQVGTPGISSAPVNPPKESAEKIIENKAQPEQTENLPATKKSLREKISDLFNGNSNDGKGEKGGIEVLQREQLQYDFASQYAKFPLAKVEGKYFYHTIRKADELLYVREPLENMKCSYRDLVKKVKELQGEYRNREYSKSYPTSSTRRLSDKVIDLFRTLSIEERMENNERARDAFMNKSASYIVSHQLGASFGEERKLKMIRMMCGLEAAHLTKEINDAFNDGMAKESFNPSVRIENGRMTFVDNNPVFTINKRDVAPIIVPVREDNTMKKESRPESVPTEHSPIGEKIIEEEKIKNVEEKVYSSISDIEAEMNIADLDVENVSDYLGLDDPELSENVVPIEELRRKREDTNRSALEREEHEESSALEPEPPVAVFKRPGYKERSNSQRYRVDNFYDRKPNLVVKGGSRSENTYVPANKGRNVKLNVEHDDENVR